MEETKKRFPAFKKPSRKTKSSVNAVRRLNHYTVGKGSQGFRVSLPRVARKMKAIRARFAATLSPFVNETSVKRRTIKRDCVPAIAGALDASMNLLLAVSRKYLSPKVTTIKAKHLKTAEEIVRLVRKQ